jgi:hypothetical protein
MKHIAKAAVMSCLVVAVSISVLLAAILFHRASIEYSEQDSFFDGSVTLNYQAWEAYSALLVLSVLVATACFVTIRKMR